MRKQRCTDSWTKPWWPQDQKRCPGHWLLMSVNADCFHFASNVLWNIVYETEITFESDYNTQLDRFNQTLHKQTWTHPTRRKVWLCIHMSKTQCVQSVWIHHIIIHQILHEYELSTTRESSLHSTAQMTQHHRTWITFTDVKQHTERLNTVITPHHVLFHHDSQRIHLHRLTRSVYLKEISKPIRDVLQTLTRHD